MSLSAGLTSSSQNFLYSKVSPADFENSTTVTSGATSNTSAVTESFPFRPSEFPCIFTLNSLAHAILKFSFLASDSSFARISGGEHFDVKSDPEFRRVSKRPDKSNPEAMEEISSNALKNGGDDLDGALMIAGILILREPEIRNLQIPILVHQQILRLQIPVRNAAAVTEIHRADQLLEILPRRLFFQPPFSHLIEKLAAFHVFHDDKDLVLRSHHFFELYNVWVLHQSHHRDFPLDLVHHGFFLHHMVFVDNLDGHALRGFEVSAVVHLRERSLTQQPPHLVLPENNAPTRSIQKMVFRLGFHGGIRSLFGALKKPLKFAGIL
nr:hypothetical protein PanWU01x14_049760 [Ipomoea batatas]GMD09265.1 hypothetical protein PanWU01x14_049760 [Ipomoea batatas]